jgi:hypothetical protein
MLIRALYIWVEEGAKRDAQGIIGNNYLICGMLTIAGVKALRLR